MTADAGGEVQLELDCRGERCPIPVIRLAQHIGEVPVGAVVAVVATDPAARHDVPAWCRMRAQGFLGEQTAPDGAARLLVRRLC